MKIYVFPGQASQFPGMGKNWYQENEKARELFEEANEILGFRLSDIMFEGSADDLKETRVTQPAVFVHSVVRFLTSGQEIEPGATAGHSLGEFSALVAAGALSFREGLLLVQKRAEAMQHACETNPGTMAAVVGLDDAIVETICNGIEEVVIPANYNCPGQLVISGSLEGVKQAAESCTAAGALKVIMLEVGGAFHSPLMNPARDSLSTAIDLAEIKEPVCPVYQNVDASPYRDPESIRKNLKAQLVSPVRWTHIMQNMIADGADEAIEVGGTGKTLQGFFKRIDRRFPTSAL